ncbi:hypothetical protein WDW37_16925 [Bdellovibrionota bacterium FG-1]
MASGSHGPENAEFEIRKAYSVIIESSVGYFWQNRHIKGVDPKAPLHFYRQAYARYHQGDRLSAERWARTAKHLGRALSSEAKISCLEYHFADLPFLTGPATDAFPIPEPLEATIDLINSLDGTLAAPVGHKQIPEQVRQYLERAHYHLSVLEQSSLQNQLLRAEHMKAAHEYGRTLEIMTLAAEAEALFEKEKRAA